MGVPAFYRWLCDRYPKCISDVKEENGVIVDGKLQPVNSSLANPNGTEYDNLYLDMNGIIHPAAHPEDAPPPETEEEMYLAIFKYIDRVFSIVRPRKLLYMAIDGVAPRAKMNQQRSRRYKAAKDMDDKEKEESKLRKEWESLGRKLPPKSTKKSWDHNVITPGTPFMYKLAEFIRFYIGDRVSNDPGWRNIKVIFSDANKPGEGEHKVIEFIRNQRTQDGYDPNTKHAIHGKDADLIMLALATHEAFFTIVRELDFNAAKGKQQQQQMQQEQHWVDGKLVMANKADFNGVGPQISMVPFSFLHVHVLREYLHLEFSPVNFGCPEGYNLERVIDDFVLMCFFVGNDFLPHLPSLDIREGAIEEMLDIYKNIMPHQGGYLSKNGNIDLARVEIMLQRLGEKEDEVFRKRKSKQDYLDRRDKQREQERKQMEEWREKQKNSGTHCPSDDTSKEGLSKESNAAAAAALKEKLKRPPEDRDENKDNDGPPSKRAKVEDVEANGKDFAESFEKHMKDKQKVDSVDEVRLFEAGWKTRYYQSKFKIDIATDTSFRRTMAQHYIEGVMWVMAYYYQGCPSWRWFYPYHYAPFASDLVDLSSMDIHFDLGQPFAPFQQLMAVFPPRSAHAIPKPLSQLMLAPHPELAEFYPTDFPIDMNGKKMAWQGVTLLPFIDETKLLSVISEKMDELTPLEKDMNKASNDMLFVHHSHVLAQEAIHATEPAESGKEGWCQIEVGQSAQLFGYIGKLKGSPSIGDPVSPPSKELQTIMPNKCVGAQYLIPDPLEHFPSLLPGADPIPPTLQVGDTIQIRPQRGRGRGGFAGGGGRGGPGRGGPHSAPAPRLPAGPNGTVGDRMIRHSLAGNPYVANSSRHNEPPFQPGYMPDSYGQRQGYAGPGNGYHPNSQPSFQPRGPGHDYHAGPRNRYSDGPPMMYGNSNRYSDGPPSMNGPNNRYADAAPPMRNQGQHTRFEHQNRYNEPPRHNFQPAGGRGRPGNGPPHPSTGAGGPKFARGPNTGGSGGRGRGRGLPQHNPWAPRR